LHGGFEEGKCGEVLAGRAAVSNLLAVQALLDALL
jgi:hypothetical protein